MKEQTIAKINNTGKIAGVITLVIKIVLIVALVACIIGTIVLFALPKDLVQIDNTLNTHVTVDVASLGLEIPADDIAAIESNFTNGTNSATFAGNDIASIDMHASSGSVEVRTEANIPTISLSMVYLPVLSGDITLLFSLIFFIFIGKLCKALKECNSPFDETVIKAMRNLAFSLIPWAFISMISNGIISGLFNGNSNMNFTLNFGTVVMIFLILGLTYIFKYGAELQRESDETL